MWLGTTNNSGYGIIKVKGKSCLVHRISYVALSGDTIPAGFDIHHRCEFILCINPGHLEPQPAKVNRKNKTSFKTKVAEAQLAFVDLT